MSKPITLNDIDDLIHAVDRIVRIWGAWNLQAEEFYSNLQFKLLQQFEQLEDEGKVNQVLNCYGKIDDFDDEEE